MRVATYNIRNIRALDWSSLWWRRRNRLKEMIHFVDADIWGLQEAYPAQSSWLKKNVFAHGWTQAGTGRNRRGGGEMCAIWVKNFQIIDSDTFWYGATPSEPGTKIHKAKFPRVATIATLGADDGRKFLVANTHLDESSDDRRHASLTQLVEWLSTRYATKAVIVMGDLNCTQEETPIEPLLTQGFSPVPTSDGGATATDDGFDNNPAGRQIDHIFVSKYWQVNSADVIREVAGASDHWPVVAELSQL